MARAHFSLEAYAPVEPAFAVAFLANLANHRDLHPLLVRADVVAVRRNEHGQEVRQYRVTDRLALGPLRYTVAYRADLTMVGETSYASEVWAGLGTRLHNRMECVAAGAGTQIRESVEVEAPGPLLGYVRRQAYLAHTRTFERLPGVLERTFREGIALPDALPA